MFFALVCGNVFEALHPFMPTASQKADANMQASMC
jgi:hypothetical protein